MKNIQSVKFYLCAILLPSLLVFSVILSASYYTNYKKQEVSTFNSTILDVIEITSFLSKITGMVETVSESLYEKEDITSFLIENVRKAKKVDDIDIEFFLTTTDGLITNSSVKSAENSYVENIPNIKKILKNHSKTYIARKTTTNSKLTYENVICVPIVNEENKYDNVLFIGFDLNKIIQERLGLHINEEDVLLLSNGVNVFGNAELLDNKRQNVKTYTLTDWTIIYEISKIPLKTKVLMIFASLIIGFGITHILYFLLLLILLKQREKIKKIETLEQIAASTAHEIKNPLTGIKGFLQILETKYQSEDDRLAFNVINEELQHIDGIATEFLFLGKPINVGETSFHLQTHILSVLALLEKEAEKKGVSFLYNIDKKAIFIKGKSTHINQVMLNIGKNAIEASEAGGMVTVLLKNIEGDAIKIEVEDNGIGIKNEDLEKIFTPFHTTKASGTGLGLLVTQKIIESYNGKIHIISKYKSGTTVKIFLPTK